MQEEEEEEVALPNGNRDLADCRKAIFEAARIGNVDQLRVALDNLDGCIDVPVKRGDSALHMTCFDGFLPCVQLLLERGANLETRDLNGANPLHNACGGGSAEVVAFLINTAPYLEVFKRILNTTDRDGDTPLHYAVSGGYLEVVQLLVREGASLTAANVRGKVPAVLAQPESEVRRFLDEAAAAVTSASNSH